MLHAWRGPFIVTDVNPERRRYNGLMNSKFFHRMKPIFGKLSNWKLIYCAHDNRTIYESIAFKHVAEIAPNTINNSVRWRIFLRMLQPLCHQRSLLSSTALSPNSTSDRAMQKEEDLLVSMWWLTIFLICLTIISTTTSMLSATERDVAIKTVASKWIRFSRL